MFAEKDLRSLFAWIQVFRIILTLEQSKGSPARVELLWPTADRLALGRDAECQHLFSSDASTVICTLHCETTCAALTHAMAFGCNRRHNYHTRTRSPMDRHPPNRRKNPDRNGVSLSKWHVYMWMTITGSHFITDMEVCCNPIPYHSIYCIYGSKMKMITMSFTRF